MELYEYYYTEGKCDIPIESCKDSSLSSDDGEIIRLLSFRVKAIAEAEKSILFYKKFLMKIGDFFDFERTFYTIKLSKAIERPTPAMLEEEQFPSFGVKRRIHVPEFLDPSLRSGGRDLLDPLGVEILRHQNKIKHSLGGTFLIKEPKHMKFIRVFFIFMNEKELLQSLEIELLQFSTRQNPDRIDELLADDFFECGKYGDRFGKKECLEGLPKESKEKIFQASNIEVIILSEGIGQVRYICTIENSGESPTTSFRTSLWRNNESGWQMFFHQGTLLQSNN